MPRLALVTHNVRGIEGIKGIRKAMSFFQMRKKKDNIGAMCFQEHNLEPDTESEIIKIAKIAGFTAIVSYGKADDHGSRRGGVMTIIDDSTLTNVKVIVSEPGIIIVTAMWISREIKIGNVYAPVRPLARIDFLNHIRKYLTDDLYIGGDWNTVMTVHSLRWSHMHRQRLLSRE